MDTGTERELSLDRYWRRRAAVLAGTAGVVAALAWACAAGGSSGDGEKKPVRNAGAIDSSVPAAPSAAGPTVTVTTTVSPSPREGGGPCEADDLVFNMVTPQFQAAGRQPRFDISVVNTSPASCRFDTGSLSVVVTSGKDRIWSSGECGRSGSGKRTLRRGIPYTEAVAWDRRRGCGGAPARPGTYVAALKGGKAAKRVFRLR
ncbi:hypothetical protein [Actinomadura verrucosospora]|uniref:DUF4232 domain-containing protein n=1 Tax=Actinomadura verrucosospora TaxID=46165 RepID=A0A7D3ZNL7_ACTVE|nr:hypothetical protein [Actinomadura verrucosospora]QKG22802.1 hypothetical protein ACTIVE_4443 [Actinomadura verrucosospora]